jgi:LytS/YehU family sensor histidine kinase
MNPHFIFNAMNSINYFISNNDRRSANRYISDFSKLIRTVLNNMNEDYVRLSAEMDSLEDYLEIEHLRFGDKFDYTLNIDPQIHPEALMVSPGFVQPFVENAIWHGVMALEERKGTITLNVTMKDKTIICTVDDDGVGRARSEAMKDRTLHGKSRGIALAMERLRIINSLHASSCRIVISDLYPDRRETGTRVIIEIPVKT